MGSNMTYDKYIVQLKIQQMKRKRPDIGITY